MFQIQDEQDRLEEVSHYHSLKREAQLKLHAKSKQKVQQQQKKRETVFAKPFEIDECMDCHPVFPKTTEQRQFIDAALGENFIFANLLQEERTMLIDAMKQEVIRKEGGTIITQGEPGDYFYILESGVVTFYVDGTVVGKPAVAGDSFGELALLYSAPRAATCKASTVPCRLWKVDQSTFRHMLARSEHESNQDIKAMLKKIPLLEHMESTQFTKFVDALTPVSYEIGERIVTKGDVGEVFYIVVEGTVKVHDIGLGDSQFSDQILSKGEWFGERALMTGELRAANVTAVSDCTCLALSRDSFEKTFGGSFQQTMERSMRKTFIKSVPIFANSNFDDHELDQLAGLISEQCFRKGEKLAQIGKPYRQDLWIIRSGHLLVLSQHGKIYQLRTGDYFGDKSIRAAPGRISSHNAIFEENSTCWVLTRADLESVIGDISRLGEYVPFVSSKVMNRSIKLKDLTKHRILGMGAFGKVWLTTVKKETEDVGTTNGGSTHSASSSASSSSSSTPYALKVMDKRQLIRAGQTKGVVREKNIMASLEHPFLLQLVSSFQDEDSLYLLLELIQGGELFNLIHTEERDGLPEHHARFYASCVAEALGHLHTRNIAYRDLKPENILIDSKGYCVVVDMGFAKVVVDKTYTLCGTPEYLAPEIVMSKGHGKAVDWWAFGVLIYEMLVGASPFYLYGTDQVAMFKRIVLVKFSIPHYVQEDAKSLINALLVRRQAGRLGNHGHGHKDVEAHPWFKSISFKKLLNRQIKAPWVPEIANPLDASHFEDFSSAERELTRHYSDLTDKQQNLFKDF